MSNHLNTTAHRHLNPDEEWEDEDGDLVENTTYQRQQKMVALLKKLAKRRNINLEKLRLGEPIRNQVTAYSVLHDFSSGKSVLRKG